MPAWYRDSLGKRYSIKKGATSMSDGSSIIIQRLWNYCNVLRDDGVSYSDYVEQLTYLIFLKMIDGVFLKTSFQQASILFFSRFTTEDDLAFWFNCYEFQ